MDKKTSKKKWMKKWMKKWIIIIKTTMTKNQIKIKTS